MTVQGAQTAAERPLRVVERALSGPSAQRADGWRERVVVVPGGHRPGRPDPQQRDRARVRLPLTGARRVVVLGCTVGAGQTITTLMTGEVLARLRTDPVAVLDLNPGHGSLAERAAAVPALEPPPQQRGFRLRGGAAAPRPEPSPLDVIMASPAGARGARADEARADDESADEELGRMFELTSARYPLALADPSAAAVPRVLAVADHLVLVAPASAAAASALAMTIEWLDAHGHAALVAAAVVVLNGVSQATMPHIDHAESIARGRCRAIVRVPWDDHLQLSRKAQRTIPPAAGPVTAPGPTAPAAPITPAALHAYTALAGVLVAGLAEVPELRSARA